MSEDRGTVTVSMDHHNSTARRIRALEAEVERLRGVCQSTIEAIYAGAEPWMLRELEAQILAALAPTGDGDV